MITRNRSFFQLLQSVISIVLVLFCYRHRYGYSSGVAVTIIAWWLLVSAFYPRLPSLSPTSVWFSGQPALSIALICFSIWSLALCAPFFSAFLIGRFAASLIIFAGVSVPLLFIPLMVEQSYFSLRNNNIKSLAYAGLLASLNVKEFIPLAHSNTHNVRIFQVRFH